MTRLQDQRDNLEEIRDDLHADIKAKNIDLDIKIEAYNQLQSDYDEIKSKFSRMKERNIKLESHNANLEDRIYDKDRELERMRGELSVLERMVQNLNTSNNNRLLQKREDIFESPKKVKRAVRFSPSSGRSGRRSRKRSYGDEDLHESENINPRGEYGKMNQIDHFDHMQLKKEDYKEQREITEKNYYLRNQGDHFEHVANVRERPRKREGKRFYGVNVQEEQEGPKKVKRHANSTENNILTWDNPYEGKISQHIFPKFSNSFQIFKKIF